MPHDPLNTQSEYKEACQELTSRLRSIVVKKERLKQLYLLEGDKAQQALDTFKTLLAHPRFPASVRINLVVATQRLAKKKTILPQTLSGVVLKDTSPRNIGGCADVFQGEYDGKIVCVKKLKIVGKGKQKRNKLIRLCAREAILWESLNHPNVHRFFGVCELDEHPCLVSPWAHHGTVSEYLENHSDANRLELAADIAEGLKYLHSIKIVHGDIKSANVLITGSEVLIAALADFGISSLSGEEVMELTGFSDVCSVGGTVRWQAPELLKATKDKPVRNTRESDVWALACTIYEIFVGKIPYHDVAIVDIKDHVVRKDKWPKRPPKKTRQLNGLNEEIWKLLKDCWNKQPEDRPLSGKIAKRFNLWTGRLRDSGRQSRRYSPSANDQIDASNRLDAVAILEGLLATIGSTNGEPTELVSEGHGGSKGRRGKRRRDSPERDSRTPKRTKSKP